MNAPKVKESLPSRAIKEWLLSLPIELGRHLPLR